MNCACKPASQPSNSRLTSQYLLYMKANLPPQGTASLSLWLIFIIQHGHLFDTYIISEFPCWFHVHVHVHGNVQHHRSLHLKNKIKWFPIYISIMTTESWESLNMSLCWFVGPLIFNHDDTSIKTLREELCANRGNFHLDPLIWNSVGCMPRPARTRQARFFYLENNNWKMRLLLSYKCKLQRKCLFLFIFPTRIFERKMSPNFPSVLLPRNWGSGQIFFNFFIISFSLDWRNSIVEIFIQWLRL